MYSPFCMNALFEMGTAFAQSQSKSTRRRLKALFAAFQRNKKDFFMRYVTMDETSIHHYTSESNRHSAEWTAKGENRPKRPKTQMLAGNVLAFIFWDAHSILFIDYLEKRRTTNSEYYMALLEPLKKEIAKNDPKWRRKKCSFTKTMHRVTSWSQQWQNCTNCTLNCLPIHRSLRIWLSATTTCVHT